MRVQGVTRQVGAFDGLKIVYNYKHGPNLQLLIETVLETCFDFCFRNIFISFLLERFSIKSLRVRPRYVCI